MDSINLSDFHFVNTNNTLVSELINKVNAITRRNIQSSIFHELKSINSDDAHNNLYTQSLILLLNVIILKYSTSVEIESSNVPNFDDITNSEIKTMLKTNKNKVTKALKKQIINILKLIEYSDKDLKTKILDILNKIIKLRLDKYHVKKHDEGSYYSESESNSDSESGNTTYIRSLAVSDTGPHSTSIQPPRQTSSGTLRKKPVINETITIEKIQTVFTVSTVSSEVLMGSEPKINEKGIITITKANLIAYINAHILILDNTTKSKHYRNVPLFRLTDIFIFPESKQDSSSITDIILSTPQQQSFGIKKLKINPQVWDTFYKYYVYMLNKNIALNIIVLLSILIFNFDFDELENTFLSIELGSLNVLIKDIIDEYNSLKTDKTTKPIVFVYNPNDTHIIIAQLTGLISSINNHIYKFKLFMIREYIRFAFYYSDTTKTSIDSAIRELLPQKNKNKYLKYKNKYLQLKKILNIN